MIEDILNLTLIPLVKKLIIEIRA